jgi:hypothetical protein
MRITYLGALVGMVLPTMMVAQGGLPGTNVSAVVRVRNAYMVGDTTTVVTLSVAVNSGSPEHLLGVIVQTLAGNLVVTSPGSAWSVFTTYHSIPGASWWNPYTIAPGDSTPTLTFSGHGIPGISRMYLRGDSDITVPDTVYVPAYDPLNDLSVKVLAVGIRTAPSGSTALAANLQVQSDSACALGWITSSGLCSTLHTSSASDAYASIYQFSASLDSARGAGSAVSDAAYWLLKPNATYTLAHITPPALSAYIPGDTATSIYTAHPSGGAPSYSYHWDWCAIDCGGGGDALRAPVRTSVRGVRPNTVVHGWNDVGYYTASICWTMSESTLRLTVTDAASTQVVVYYTVPDLEHNC